MGLLAKFLGKFFRLFSRALLRVSKQVLELHFHIRKRVFKSESLVFSKVFS